MPDRTTRVLVVDDEPSMRKSLALILSDEGYDVETAEDGEQAVARCAQEEFDVVLMDVKMPGMNGVEAFRQIRQHRVGARVILMSAFGMDQLKQRALEEGAIAFLEKPLNLEQAIALIENAAETAILVVEPHDETAAALHSLLQQHGYRVSVAGSPHEALHLVEQIRFDVVLIDVDLEVMNGRDLYLAIRKLTPAAVAIMIAGAQEEFLQLAREAVEQTAYAFVQKPMDLDSLIDMLSRVRSQRVSGAVRKPEPEE